MLIIFYKDLLTQK